VTVVGGVGGVGGVATKASARKLVLPLVKKGRTIASKIKAKRRLFCEKDRDRTFLSHDLILDKRIFE